MGSSSRRRAAALTIGPGRMYVDGLLAENHGGDPVAWNAVARRAARDDADRVRSPAVPAEPGEPPAGAEGGGPFLVYLDVWKREVTRTSRIRVCVEKAVGVDTATRTQTVWQVKVYPPPGSKAG